jgi:hypothetical protein
MKRTRLLKVLLIACVAVSSVYLYANNGCIVSENDTLCVYTGEIYSKSTCHHPYCTCATTWEGTIWNKKCSSADKDSGYYNCETYTQTATVGRAVHHQTWNALLGGCVDAGTTDYQSGTRDCQRTKRWDTCPGPA